MSYTNDSNNTCVYVLTTSVISTFYADNSPFYSEMGIFTRLRHVKLRHRESKWHTQCYRAGHWRS